MTMSSTSVRGGSVPSDPAAARAFLQRRVAIYVGLALVIWSFAFLVDRAIKWLSFGDMFAESHGWYLHAHYLAIAVLVGMLFATRRGQLGAPALRVIEVSATLLQAVLSAILLVQLPPAARPEFMCLFASTLFLVLRAGIVPGTPGGALIVGVLAVSPSIALAIHLFSTQPLPNSGITSPGLAIAYMVEWAVMALATTTSVHAVIYGLHERVQELGQYTLLHKIGEGGMGVVYRARHALLRRATAVKVLPLEHMTPTGVARFEREVQLTAELTHPNIVSVYDFGRTPDGSFFYAMEFLDGIDLQRLVEESGPLPAARVVHLVVQAADALAEAHAVGLIHRDIKPANLLLSNPRRRPDHLTVVDFGLAKDYTDRDAKLSSAEALTGTPLYMAPEAIVTPAEVDGRSDLYALGAVAYWLLTGTPPFTGRSVVEVCAAHLHSEPERPSARLGAALPEELEALILACLAKEPQHRPSSAAELVDRLRALPVAVWSTGEAQRWWQARGERAPAPGKAPLELAGTLAIARRDAPPL